MLPLIWTLFCIICLKNHLVCSEETSKYYCLRLDYYWNWNSDYFTMNLTLRDYTMFCFDCWIYLWYCFRYLCLWMLINCSSLQIPALVSSWILWQQLAMNLALRCSLLILSWKMITTAGDSRYTFSSTNDITNIHENDEEDEFAEVSQLPNTGDDDE